MDYPRDYAAANLDINLGTAFVVMPIKQEFGTVMGWIIEVCENLGIKAQRADDFTNQNFIISNICEGIVRSEIVIVDITGTNPNVFYELGIAHTSRARNSVIIITQEEDIPKTTPFDIRHWSILKYSGSNRYSFQSLLKEKINNCRRFINNEEFINNLLRGHRFENDLIKQFIDKAKQINETNLELSCSILSDNASIQLCDRDKVLDLNIYLTTLGDYKDGKFQKIAWLLKYLIYTSDFVLSQYIDSIKTKFLTEWSRDSIHTGDSNYWEFVTNICFKIIEKKYTDKHYAIECLMKYLQNAKVGRIDNVRTKIENFMVTIQDKDVDKVIIDTLLKDESPARESAVDICGQKPIYESVNNLLQIIKNNDPSPFTIRSCIYALARMNITIAAPIILKWMEENRDKWGAQAVSSTLMPIAEKALQELDKEAYIRLSILKNE